MKLRKGISPVIATVIIVAVALAIAIAVVGWIMGIWGAVTGGTEMLKIYPDSYIKTGTGESCIIIHLRNEGGGSAVIYKIEVSGLDTATINGTSTDGSTFSSATSPITVKAGEELYIQAKMTKEATPGATYTIKVYTRAGNVYTAQVQAK